MNDKVVYEVDLKVTVFHPIDGLENLKDNNEFANDLVAMICDEATVSGGCALVDVKKSSMNVV